MSVLTKVLIAVMVLLAAPCYADSVATQKPVMQVSLVTKAYNAMNVSYVAFCVDAQQRSEDYFYYYFAEGTYEEKRASQIFAMLLAAKASSQAVDVYYVTNGQGKQVITALNTVLN